MLSTSYFENEKTNVMLYCQLEDLLEGVDRILTAYGITFIIPNVVVRGKKDAKSVIRCFKPRVRTAQHALQ